MDTTATLQAVQALPLEDRLELLFQVWDQLLDEGWQPTLSEELKAELDRRWANYLANPASGLSEDQVMAHVRRMVQWRATLDTEVPMTLTLEVDLPADLARFRLPEAVAARLQDLLDRQDSGQPLTAREREEAEGLVNLAEFFTLLRQRAERMTP
jgi:putative addiction module component (TIGR02574 family)